VLPGVIALVLLAAPHLTKHRLGTLLALLLTPLVVAIAFIPAPVVINGKHDLWPVNASERAVAVAIVAGILGLLAAALRRHRRLAPAPAFIAGSFAALAVLIALHPHAVSTPLLSSALLMSGAWVGAGAHLLGRAEVARAGPTVPAMLALALFATSLVMLFSAIGTYAQQVGALVAVLSAATLVAFWKKRATLGIGGITAILSILAYFLVGAWQFSRNPPLGALAVAAALPLAIPLLARFASRSRAAFIGAWATLAILCVGAAGWAFMIYRAAQNAAPPSY
jgi:hypothetical protein